MRILRIEPHNPARVTLASRVHALAMYIRGRDELASASSTAASGTPSVVKRRSGLRRSGAPAPLRRGASGRNFQTCAPALRRATPALRRSSTPALQTRAWVPGMLNADSFLMPSSIDLRRARGVTARPASTPERSRRFQREPRSFAREPFTATTWRPHSRTARRRGLPSAELQSGRSTVTSGDLLQSDSKSFDANELQVTELL